MIGDRWMDGMFWWGREQDGVWGGQCGVMIGWGWMMVVLSLGLGLVLGDCVWCVLLPETVANATLSSKMHPRVSHD